MPAPVFVLMPQWQGSSSSRAMQLAEGAAALAEDLPASARRDVAVPLEAGDAMGTPVARLSSVMRARDAAREVIAGLTPDAQVPIIVGGDCSTSLAGLEAAVKQHGAENLAVLWCDAHPDAQDPSTSPSGSAAGMTLRHALGEGAPDLASPYPVDPSRVTLLGTRASDPEEVLELERLDIASLGTPVVQTDPDAAPQTLTESLAARIAELGATHVYVHIDLDVLDPAEFRAVHAPVPFGLSVQELLDAVRTAVSLCELAGAAICEFAPADPEVAADDLPTILLLLGALTSNGRR